MREYLKSQLLKWEERLLNDKEEGSEREAESKAEGKRASATTRKTGAENRRKEIIMVIKKNKVLTPLHNLLDFSSFENPISSFSLLQPWVVFGLEKNQSFKRKKQRKLQLKRKWKRRFNVLTGLVLWGGSDDKDLGALHAEATGQMDWKSLVNGNTYI